MFDPRFWTFSWALQVLEGIFSAIVAFLRVVGGCFKGCFVGASMRVIEDILLSERDGEGWEQE
jgi:hypothetical protein